MSRRSGWRDDRLAAAAILALGMPFVLVPFFGIPSQPCVADPCQLEEALRQATNLVAITSVFWMPVLALFAFWSRPALLGLAAAGVALAIATEAVSTDAPGPLFLRIGAWAGIAGCCALADLLLRRDEGHRAPR